MKLTALFLALLTAALPAAATGEDLVNCRYNGGATIPPNVCDLLRKHAAEDERRAAAAKTDMERFRKEEAQSKADRAEADRQAELQAKARADSDKAEQARMRASMDEANREQAAAEEQHERRMAQLQRECGADFQAPRVGMSLARAKRCVGDLKLYGQNGPVSAYRAGSLLLSVVDGKVTKWVVFQQR